MSNIKSPQNLVISVGFFVGLFLWGLGVCGLSALFFRIKMFKCA